MNTRIRLIIADDHPLVVDGLQGYFRAHPDFEVVAVTGRITDVEQIVEAHLPDVLLIDYHFANEKITGLDVCKRIQAKHPAVGIIVASSFSDVSLIRDFINAGAKGYLLKTASQQEFIDAVKSVFAGGEFFSHDTRDLLIKHRLSGGQTERIRFTRTEKEILRLIIEGYSTTEIAKRLFREKTTIDSHRKSILAKFQMMDANNPKPSKNISHYIAKFNVIREIDSL